MIRWRTVLVLVLAALWLPATSHCALESAALITSHCCASDAHDEPAHDAGSDLCCAWENALLAQSSPALALKAPALACPCVLCLADLLSPLPLPEAAVPAATRPTDWLVSWQFDCRAAPPARAPSLI